MADDHPLVQIAISQMLSADGDFTVVASANSGEELLHTLQATPCDLIVTDFVMPPFEEASTSNLDGIRLIGLLRRKHPSIPIVVSTTVPNGGILKSMITAGVHGIVGKDEPSQILAQICKSVMSGAKPPVLSPRVAMRLGHYVAPSQIATVQQLSQKESEVVRLFAQGHSLTDIARQLNRAITTVATQKRSAMRKLNVNNNADLIRYAADTGIV
ncbi:response regulator transcription factor [Bordetella genomosp. 5]|uniref:response regulator transcription factor n=1 Tax=Bordetella genomosp. 5 TaxID=1395608 RepID=UPI0020CC7FE4|nr:response regulator transcription factor [Bordetella genomosp. 5]